MSSSGADLFVVCKSCGSEVSPYVTECPYCGTRVRKRAPKLEKGGTPKPPKQRRSRPAKPSLGRLRRGEMPGIRLEGRPYATIALVVLSLLASIVWRAGAFQPEDYVILGSFGDQWWRLLSSPLVYTAAGYQFVCLGVIFLFGWLLERRHGRAVPVLVFVAGGAASMALASLNDPSVAAGGNGAALALLGAWVVPDLLARRGGDADDSESDLLGAGVMAALVLLLPLVVVEADGIAGIGGLATGLLLGLPLAGLARRQASSSY